MLCQALTGIWLDLDCPPPPTHSLSLVLFVFVSISISLSLSLFYRDYVSLCFLSLLFVCRASICLSPSVSISLLLSASAKVLHELLTPPKKLRHQDTFTIDESEWTSKIAPCRVVIENVIKEGRSWKLLNRTIKVFLTLICLCVLMAMCVACMFACV